MPFQSVIMSSSQMGNLASNLNTPLASYPGASVVDVGLAWGNDKNRAGILLDVPPQPSTGPVVVAETLSDSGNLGDLAEQVQNWLASMSSTVTILDLALIKSNDKWKALILYTGADSGITYSIGYEQEERYSTEQSDIDTDLASASSVAAFGFTYGNSTYGALYIYST